MIRIEGGVAPLATPTRGLDPLTPRLASKAIGHDASLGIELAFGWDLPDEVAVLTRPNERSHDAMIRIAGAAYLL